MYIHTFQPPQLATNVSPDILQKPPIPQSSPLLLLDLLKAPNSLASTSAQIRILRSPARVVILLALLVGFHLTLGHLLVKGVPGDVHGTHSAAGCKVDRAGRDETESGFALLAFVVCGGTFVDGGGHGESRGGEEDEGGELHGFRGLVSLGLLVGERVARDGGDH